MGRRPIDLTGQTFGRLTVLGMTDKRQGGNVIFRCTCTCGDLKEVAASNLKSGQVKSCGCLAVETVTKHGAGRDGAQHPLYIIHAHIKSRCYNVNDTEYHNYGGRGIALWPEWHNYVLFRDHMLSLENCPANIQTPGAKATLTVERMDNNGNYEPGNIRWATRKEQANNRRTNRLFKVNGIMMTLRQAVDKYGKAPYLVVLKRLRRGWDLKKALLTEG